DSRWQTVLGQRQGGQSAGARGRQAGGLIRGRVRRASAPESDFPPAKERMEQADDPERRLPPFGVRAEEPLPEAERGSPSRARSESASGVSGDRRPRHPLTPLEDSLRARLGWSSPKRRGGAVSPKRKRGEAEKCLRGGEEAVESNSSAPNETRYRPCPPQ